MGIVHYSPIGILHSFKRCWPLLLMCVVANAYVVRSIFLLYITNTGTIKHACCHMLIRKRGKGWAYVCCWSVMCVHWRSFEMCLHACELLLDCNGIAEPCAYAQDTNDSWNLEPISTNLQHATCNMRLWILRCLTTQKKHYTFEHAA